MDFEFSHPFMDSTGNFSKFMASLQIWGIHVEKKKKGGESRRNLKQCKYEVNLLHNTEYLPPNPMQITPYITKPVPSNKKLG